jgi:hypothetical protein
MARGHQPVSNRRPSPDGLTLRTGVDGPARKQSFGATPRKCRAAGISKCSTDSSLTTFSTTRRSPAARLIRTARDNSTKSSGPRSPTFKPVDLKGRVTSEVFTDLVPGARVVKAFNHLRAQVLAGDLRADGACCSIPATTTQQRPPARRPQVSWYLSAHRDSK